MQSQKVLYIFRNNGVKTIANLTIFAELKS